MVQCSGLSLWRASYCPGYQRFFRYGVSQWSLLKGKVVTGKLLPWLESYLSNRSIKLVLSGQSSCACAVPSMALYLNTLLSIYWQPWRWMCEHTCRGRNNSNISGSQQDYLAEKFGSPYRYLVVEKWPRCKQNNMTNTKFDKYPNILWWSIGLLCHHVW